MEFVANRRLQHHYAKGSEQRAGLAAALAKFQERAPLQVPLVVGGKEVSRGIVFWCLE